MKRENYAWRLALVAMMTIVAALSFEPGLSLCG
jgi:hypothetical protein